jgi:hypothetical protein
MLKHQTRPSVQRYVLRPHHLTAVYQIISVNSRSLRLYAMIWQSYKKPWGKSIYNTYSIGPKSVSPETFQLT